MKTDNVIRFDWAAKNIFRDKADFTILQGLVSAILGEKVIITELLESEGNQQHKEDKFNRVDIKAINNLGEIILIEVQQSDDLNFLKRILYSTAKTITEHITSGKDYENVKKVFSINILYFNLGMGDDYLYHGQSELTGVHTGDHLVLGNENFPSGLRMEAMNNIFPEYYVLRVSQFDATKEPASDLDEWMRYLKVGFIDPETKVPGLREAKERLDVLNMSPEERKRYEDYRFERHYDENMLKAARYVGREEGREEGLEEGLEKGLEKGRKEGREEGREEGLSEGRELGVAENKRETARRMLSMGMEKDTILQVTGLNEEELLALGDR